MFVTNDCREALPALRSRLRGSLTVAEVHVCLASDQRLANVIPVLMRRPSVVHVVTSDEKRNGAEELKRFLTDCGVKVEVHENAPDFDTEGILAYAEDLELTLDEASPDANIVLNATGGNKLMALGFVQAIRVTGAQVLYTDIVPSALD